jgi:hypothetical protein
VLSKDAGRFATKVLLRPESGSPERDSDDPVTTPRRLRTRAASLESRAQALVEEAAVLRRAADELDAARERRAGRSHQDEGLSERLQPTNVDTEVSLAASHAFAIARGQAARLEQGGRKLSALSRAAHAKKMTLRSLARAVGKRLKRDVHHSVLSNAHSGDRPVPRDVADAVEALIGFSATKANWPGGIDE